MARPPKPRLFQRWPAAILVLSLIALGVIGVWVGDLYRHQVREQMARVERSMALARHRQEDLLARLNRATRLIEAQQRQIEIQGQALNSTQRRLRRRELGLEHQEKAAERPIWPDPRPLLGTFEAGQANRESGDPGQPPGSAGPGSP